MTLVRKNIIANLIGSGWLALLSFIFIPFYIHFLGIEAYGLIGFYSVLLAMLSRLNLGLKATLTRELARRSAQPDSLPGMRDLVRSIEVMYWPLGGLLMLGIALASGLIVDYWINLDTIEAESARTAVMLMSVVFGFEFLFGLYVGGLIGLQKQVLQNGIVIVTATLRFGGAVLVLWLFSPTIQAFFMWQVVVTLLQLGLGVYFLWQALAGTGTVPTVRWRLLKDVRGFAFGMMGVSVLGFMLIQMPLIMLSNLLPLQEFAYYSLAMQVAFILLFIISPVVMAVSPELCVLISSDQHSALRGLYHKACQLVAVAVLPVAVVLCLFAPEFLMMWTGNPQVVEHAAMLVILLSIGSACNGLINMPSTLMIAYGWTKLIVQFNSVAVLFMIPLLWYLVPDYGAVSAASLWLVLNLMWVLVGVYLLHRHYLVGDLRRWLIRDVGVQLLASVAVAVVVRFMIPMPDGRLQFAFLLVLVWVGALLVSVAVSSELRPLAKRLWHKKLRVQLFEQGVDDVG